MLEKYPDEIRLVIKNFPLPMHPLAPKAAAASLAAGRQGKFWEYHRKLFEEQSSLSEEKLQAIARDLHLNMTEFNKDLNDPAIQKTIRRDLGEAEQAEVPGTPTLFLNGRRVQFRSPQDIEQAVAAELKRKKEASAGRRK